MHYYKRNIGDYHKKAGRLSVLEHGAYMLLMDACYDRERFPTIDEAIDWLWARDDKEVDAIKFVLNKFFTLQDDGSYVQNRIREELSSYQSMAETNQRIAKEREDKRRKAKGSKGLHANSTEKHEACSSVYEAPPNQEPLTTNQEPLTTNQETIEDDSDDYKKAFENKKDYEVFMASYESIKVMLKQSGVIPIAKPINDDWLKPEVYRFNLWFTGKGINHNFLMQQAATWFNKKTIDERKAYYTFPDEVNRNYYNPDDYPKSEKVSDEAAAAIRAKGLGALGL